MSAVHDPLCWSQVPLSLDACRVCAEYARVRADERQRARQRVEAVTYTVTWEGNLVDITGDQLHAMCAAAAGGDAA